MTIETFIEELQKNSGAFKENMQKLNDRREQSYPDWHRDFTRWCEVGTEMEAHYYPKVIEIREQIRAAAVP